ncbi:hypothetical protein D3C77_632760 [compost metagenome]
MLAVSTPLTAAEHNFYLGAQPIRQIGRTFQIRNLPGNAIIREYIIQYRTHFIEGEGDNAP